MDKGYDKTKAHDYYMKHRKLKGKRRKAKPKATGGKISQRKNKKKERQKMAYTLATSTQSGGKAVKLSDKQHEDYNARIKAKIADIVEKSKNLPPEKKTALKSALKSIRSKIKKR